MYRTQSDDWQKNPNNSAAHRGTFRNSLTLWNFTDESRANIIELGEAAIRRQTVKCGK
jgi:hypothetical protein